MQEAKHYKSESHKHIGSFFIALIIKYASLLTPLFKNYMITLVGIKVKPSSLKFFVYRICGVF